MDVFLWNMVISYQLLFIVISSVVFLISKDKSFKFYSLYNFFLIIYILSRHDSIYDGFENFLAKYLDKADAKNLVYILTYFLQVLFYNFYAVFVLHFLDLDRYTRKYYNAVILILKILAGFFLAVAIISYVTKNSKLFWNLFTFVYLPCMLALFIPSCPRVFKYTGKHKYYLIFGVFIFIIFALIAFAGSNIEAMNMTNPISFFYAGIVFETIFFSLGLAHKVKILSEERNRIRNLVIHHRHKQYISKIQGLLEGEEKEKKRMAEELHDGIVGDLSAIKINLHYLAKTKQDSHNVEILEEVSQIIDKSCLQIREISHNLSPSNIVNYGLISSIESFCENIEFTYKIACNFKFSGPELTLHIDPQTHIYRIIQELVQNIVKHAESEMASVEICHHPPMISIVVEDFGKGFTPSANLSGIGLHNIQSRIKILNATMIKEEIAVGSRFMINLDTTKLADK